MFRFLIEVEIIMGNDKGYKKRLAKAVGVSQSYITQLFNGDKIINLTMLAKIQKELGIKFEIKATVVENKNSARKNKRRTPTALSQH